MTDRSGLLFCLFWWVVCPQYNESESFIVFAPHHYTQQLCRNHRSWVGYHGIYLSYDKTQESLYLLDRYIWYGMYIVVSIYFPPISKNRYLYDTDMSTEDRNALALPSAGRPLKALQCTPVRVAPRWSAFNRNPHDMTSYRGLLFNINIGLIVEGNSTGPEALTNYNYRKSIALLNCPRQWALCWCWNNSPRYDVISCGFVEEEPLWSSTDHCQNLVQFLCCCISI